LTRAKRKYGAILKADIVWLPSDFKRFGQRHLNPGTPHDVRLISHPDYPRFRDESLIFQMAEVAVPQWLFRAILERIRRLRPPETVPG
jgi:hypothetical protein